ncbi:MAG TPA: hypothetical protein VHV08_10515, partial [Pirellulales bacterium]|nr:hypothetical protein [Pirellulales bacterium]
REVCLQYRLFNCPQAVALAVCLIAAGCGRPPQLGDEQCLKVADALWTAVTAKNVALLDRTGNQIDSLHAERKLSDDGRDALAEIVATARDGEWLKAQATLKSLLRAQRRSRSDPPHD